jgi:hypothetical protein
MVLEYATMPMVPSIKGHGPRDNGAEETVFSRMRMEKFCLEFSQRKTASSKIFNGVKLDTKMEMCTLESFSDKISKARETIIMPMEISMREIGTRISDPGRAS